MSFNERSLATSASINAQGNASSSSLASAGGPNNSDEQTEPTSTLGIFALDYKK